MTWVLGIRLIVFFFGFVFWLLADSPTNLLLYVYGFQQRLLQTRELAKEKLEKPQESMKRLCDSNLEWHVFEP